MMCGAPKSTLLLPDLLLRPDTLIGPIAMNPNAFYFSDGQVSIGSVLALVGFGLFTSLGGGQKAFKQRQFVWQS
jgi:hypothetical protein